VVAAATVMVIMFMMILATAFLMAPVVDVKVDV
jgi:hypothetical protein